MLHLPTERLAALSDDPPTPEEAAHLAGCDVCAREQAAYESLLTLAAGEREPFGLPLTRWDSIAAALRHEAAAAPVLMAPRHVHRGMLQIAAALLLVAGGTMLGRVSAGAGVLPDAAMARAASSASSGHSADSVVFSSTEAARVAQQESEVLYQQATAFLAKHDTTESVTSSSVAYRSRLAALDRVISTTREAMRDVPHDPVINGYYLTTLGQREATLRQLNTSLPASLRVNSF